MNRDELKRIWRDALAMPREEKFHQIAEAVLEIYSSDTQIREHIKNRSARVSERTGVAFDGDGFDIASARAFVADEIGFTGWNGLLAAVAGSNEKPILFRYAAAAMDRGDFTSLEEAIGSERFHDQVVEWFEIGLFANEPDTLNEVFAASCMLGQTETAAYLLDKGVDPYAGMKTGLAGFHYAASSGRLEVIKLLIDRGVPMEVENMYGGTVFGQAVWSAIYENTPYHSEIVEALIMAGAEVEDGYSEWWEKQHVPDRKTKERIANVLARQAEFQNNVADAEREVANAEGKNNKRLLADSLKALGNILRRPPFLRDRSNSVYERAANIYREIGLPLEEAWVKRHIGINHEYAERLQEAEKYYDGSLELFRQNADENDGNYANTLRYPAVIKNRLGKRDESAALWREAVNRYQAKLQPSGVAEGSAWLTRFAIESGDLEFAKEWLAKASEAALASNDPDTRKFVNQVRSEFEAASEGGR